MCGGAAHGFPPVASGPFGKLRERAGNRQPVGLEWRFDGAGAGRDQTKAGDEAGRHQEKVETRKLKRVRMRAVFGKSDHGTVLAQRIAQIGYV